MNARLAAGLFIAAGIVGACVIAEPPLDLPTAPAARPTILRASVFPPPSAVLTGWPDNFIVPVQLSDARQKFFATWFIDYNATSKEGYVDNKPSTPETSNPSPVRVLSLRITEPTSDGCHTIEVIVATAFRDLNSTSDLAHTPIDPVNDGDSITWFYSPSGDPSGCPIVDAGLAPVVDVDAGDAGDGG